MHAEVPKLPEGPGEGPISLILYHPSVGTIDTLEEEEEEAAVRARVKLGFSLSSFFKRQETSVASQANTFRQKFTVPDRALKASFLVSFHIDRGKKPHTVGENFLF